MDLKKALFSFKGRIRRSEFNKLWIPLSVVQILFVYLDFKIALFLYIVTLWPLFALTTKRYHDFGSKGLLGIFQLLPWAGWLIVFVGCSFTIGDYKDNKYGPSTYRQ